MKALDIVRTPLGGIAVVTETHGHDASIKFINGCSPKFERTAWWNEDELFVIDSIPHLLAVAMCHPCGNGKVDAEKFFGIEEARG